MELLSTNNDLKFYVDQEFNIKYLSPIQKNVQWKLENDRWDDYNELYHASKFIENLKVYNISFDSHLLYKNDNMIGVLFIVRGAVTELEKAVNSKDEAQSLLLKYFHITEKGNGHGGTWLKSVIIPYYRKKGFKQIYVNSSHVESFPFYTRLGEKISEYEQISDNQLNKRRGHKFLIKL